MKRVVELPIAIGQTSRVDTVRRGQVDTFLRLDNSQIPGEPTGFVLRMDDDIGDVILLMPTRLRRVEAGGVVFIHADLQIVGIVLAEFMRGRDDLACSPRDIVVKVVRDDGATGDEVIVPIQDQAGPRKFVGGGLASLKVIGVVEFPLSASLFSISSVVVAVGIATSTSGGAESQLVADEAESDVVTSTTASTGGARDLSPLFSSDIAAVSGNGLTGLKLALAVKTHVLVSSRP